MRQFQIAVLPGDGIGHEVVPPCLELLDAAATRVGGFILRYRMFNAGAAEYLENGVALPDAAIKGAEAADAVLLGAMGLPDVRYPNGTEIAPQVDIRERF